MLTQILLVGAIILLAISDPAASPWSVAGAALLVTTASATQDIVIDAFRVESLPENEQAAGMASYVAAYRIAVLVSSAGALFLVSGLMDSALTNKPPTA
jgi:PAT family beta-lactamase induction signal transducer AmpG